MNKQQLPTLIAVLLAGILIGVLVGRRQAGTPASARIPLSQLSAAIDQALEQHEVSKAQSALIRIAGQIATNDVPAALEQVSRISSDHLASLFRNQLVSRWAVTEPRAALAFAMALPVGGNRAQACDAALRVWAGREPKAVVAWARETTESALASSALRQGPTELCRADPEGALRLLEEAGSVLDPVTARSIQHGAFREIGEKDPAEAVRRWAALDAPQINENSYQDLFVAWLAKDNKGAVTWLRTQTDAEFRAKLLRQIMYRFIPPDPPALLELINELPEGTDRSYAKSGLLQRWAQHDLQGFSQWLLAQPAGKERREAMQNLVREMIAKDLMKAAEFVKTLPVEEQQGSIMDSLVYEWVKHDPDGVIAYLKNIKSEEGRKHGIAYVVRLRASKDPAKMAALARNLLAGSHRQRAFADVLPAWAGVDGAAAAAFLDGETNAALREAIIPDMASKWAQRDVQGAAKWVLSLANNHASRRAASIVASQMMEKDPAGAATFAGQLPEGSEKELIIAFVATRWAKDDAEKTMAWLETQPEQTRNNAVLKTVDGLTREQPMAAMKMLSRIDPRLIANRSLDGLVQALAARDPRLAFEWLQGITNAGKSRLYSDLMFNWAEKEPAAACQRADSLSNPQERRSARTAALRRWSASDPKAAASYAVQVGPEFERNEALQTVIGGWKPRDDAAVQAWIKSLPPGAGRDRCWITLIGSTSYAHPEKAVVMADEIDDEAARNRSYESTAREWLRVDPTQARKWIESSRLPQGAKDRLLKQK